VLFFFVFLQILDEKLEIIESKKQLNFLYLSRRESRVGMQKKTKKYENMHKLQHFSQLGQPFVSPSEHFHQIFLLPFFKKIMIIIA
jgi:hypothetical protein